jgi:hypothetical protein
VVDHTTKIGELQGKYDELSGVYAANAEAHNVATRAIILGFIQQQLAADGLTQEEMGFILKLGEKWGVYGEDTAAVFDATMDSLKDGLLDADATAAAVAARMPGYFTDIDVNVNYNIRTNGRPNIPNAAAGDVGLGGDALVGVTPGSDDVIDGRLAAGGPVWPGGTFLVGERGPELFAPSGAGNIIPTSVLTAGGGSTSWTGDINIYGATDPETTTRAVLQALADRGLVDSAALR